jgi:hypothetical protein
LFKKLIVFIFVIIMALPQVSLFAASQLLLPSSQYYAPVLKGLRFDPKDPLKITFLIDTGSAGTVTAPQAKKLIDYFMAGLTLPQNDLWVNLSPYEKERMVPDKLVLTELGEDMLKEDYTLKQLAASLTYPETESGKSYWNAMAGVRHQKCQVPKVSGTAFNKVWIVPGKAAVYEKNNCALVTEANLKVLTQEDYLAVQKNNVRVGATLAVAQNKRAGASPAPTLNPGAESFKTHILPLIDKEVNEGKDFARLRQIYHSLILAIWFKQKFQKTFYRGYINQSRVAGIDLSDKDAGEKIFKLYVAAFEEGSYDYVKRDYDKKKQKIISRRYFSGEGEL